MGCMDCFSQVSTTFRQLFLQPYTLHESMAIIEKCVVLIYYRTRNTDEVNICRKQLFSKKGRSLESIPLTQDALKLHAKRAIYQTSFCWNQALIPCPEMPFPENGTGNSQPKGLNLFGLLFQKQLKFVQNFFVASAGTKKK